MRLPIASVHVQVWPRLVLSATAPHAGRVAPPEVSGSKLRCPPFLCFGLSLPCNLSSCPTRSCCLHCYRSVPFPACYSSQPSLDVPALGS